MIVEDPDRPLAVDAAASGTATITVDDPERVEVATDSAADAYLVLADSFDPGWSAVRDGRPVPIRPAFVAFRGVVTPPTAPRDPGAGPRDRTGQPRTGNR